VTEPKADVESAAPVPEGPRWLTPAAVIAVLVGLSIAGMGAGRLDAGRRARGDLADAVTTVREVDSVVLGVDAAVQATTAPGVGRRARDLVARIPPARQRLLEAMSTMERAEPGLTGGDVQTAQRMRESVRERVAMLDAALVMLPAVEKSSAAIGPLRDALTLVGEAAELSDQAVVRYNEHTRVGVAASTVLTKQAIAKLAVASARLAEVRKAWDSIDVAPCARHIRQRQALATESLRIDAAWLSGDVEGANAMLDAYAVRQAALSRDAEKLSGSVPERVAIAYAQAVGPVAVRYERARSRAMEVDAILRRLDRQPSS
jgi:hypothetical protein